ncbi:MAG: Cys-tRNA(Pro) deacylase [Pseudomonadota bacterium]
MDYPITTAVRALRAAQITFGPHLYDYVDKGGTAVSAAALGVDEHAVIKTIVLEDEHKKPLIALMHGTHEVSTKNLARHLGVKSITPCSPESANKHTGYLLGGTSPFGTKKTLPVYAQESIQQCPCIYINGGKRGFLVSIKPSDLARALPLTWVNIAA